MLGKSTYATLVGILVLACIAAPVNAGNVQFLKGSAISKMTDADLEMLRSTARNALDYTADGESRRWENVATGAKGIVTPLSTSDERGMLCRELEVFNEVAGIAGRSVFEFCRQVDGTWRIPAKARASGASQK